MSVVRWAFADPVTSAVYTLETNPDTATPAERERNFYQAPTTAAGGKNTIMQGRDRPTTASFSGKVYSEAAYQFLSFWFDKPRVITIEDDLSRTQDAVLEQITFERAPHRNHRWRQIYTVNYRVMSVAA